MAHPIVSIRTYTAVWAALMALLVATVGLHFVNAGPFNLVAALVIAVMKATLVLLFFMHIKYGSRLMWVASVAGLYWLGILLLLALSDYTTRSVIREFGR